MKKINLSALILLLAACGGDQKANTTEPAKQPEASTTAPATAPATSAPATATPPATPAPAPAATQPVDKAKEVQGVVDNAAKEGDKAAEKNTQ
jgi:hypothetical protein